MFIKEQINKTDKKWTSISIFYYFIWYFEVYCWNKELSEGQHCLQSLKLTQLTWIPFVSCKVGSQMFESAKFLTRNHKSHPSLYVLPRLGHSHPPFLCWDFIPPMLSFLFFPLSPPHMCTSMKELTAIANSGTLTLGVLGTLVSPGTCSNPAKVLPKPWKPVEERAPFLLFWDPTTQEKAGVELFSGD